MSIAISPKHTSEVWRATLRQGRAASIDEPWAEFGSDARTTVRENRFIYDEENLAVAFEEDPPRALSELVRALEREGLEREGRDDTGSIHSIHRFKAIHFIFARMIDGTPFMKRLGANAILSFADPGEILSVARHEYRLHGYEARLTTAASLLSRMGARAWTVLASLAKSGLPECECFVPIIATLDGVPEPDRVRALVNLAANPDSSTRGKVLEVIEQLPDSQRGRVLQVLAATGSQEDYIRQSAALSREE